MKLLVMGAGAVGCFVGGYLAVSGHQVTLVGRPALMEQIATAGLILRWPGRAPQTVFPDTATTVPISSNAYDFILLTVKSPATEQAIVQLTPLAATPAVLVSLQNGIGNEEAAATTFSPDKVIAGTITIPVQMSELGVVEVSKNKGGLGLAPLHPAQMTSRLAAVLNEAGLKTLVYPDYRAMKWSKLLLNIVNNASSAILNLPPAQVIAWSDLFNLEIEAMGEAVAVMKAQNIRPVRLPGYPVDWLARLVAACWLPFFIKRMILRPFMIDGRGTKTPSLQLDLAAGRSVSEVGALNGAIVRAGQKYQVPTPVNRVLTDLLSGLAAGKLAWGDYQQQPQKLIQAIAATRNSSPVSNLPGSGER